MELKVKLMVKLTLKVGQDATAWWMDDGLPGG